MASQLRSQLHAAYLTKSKRDGLTFRELARRSGLPLTADSVSRKIRNKQVLLLEEAEAFGGVLDFEVTIRRIRRAA